MTAGLVIFLIWLFLPLKGPLICKDYSQVIYANDGTVLRAFLNDNEQWCFPPSVTDTVPDKLKQTIVYYEDQYFEKHPGVNPVAVFKALKQNIAQKRIVSGASTITMQLARMRFQNSRTYVNKIAEMLFALKIEMHTSKDNILSAYVNHAPYGRNIIGYQAASLKYFQKLPRDLSWSEAATLAVLPNAPGMVSPGQNNRILTQKRDFLLNKLYDNNVFSELTLKTALNEPLVNRVFPLNRSAEHLTNLIHTKGPEVDVVETTIDLKLQQYIEYVCQNYQHNIEQFGIHNLSALVVENKTGFVKSYIGSANFTDLLNLGQNDGVQAPRSSGSILKPFLYALSIDEGLISTKALIKDIPTYYDGFSPSNADHKFRGIVPAEEALIRSLNIPAVRLLNSYGTSSFYYFLKQTGVSTLFRPADGYGLTLILGGAEVTPWDIAQLYRGLALDGNFLPISYLKRDSLEVQIGNNQLISKGSIYQVREAMKELNRPGEEQFWKQYMGSRSIAWKTGTSYGHKDAWAAGITPNYTVVVWAGNFSGEGNVKLGGATIAGPLMIELFNYLGNKHDNWFEKDEMAFTTVKICKETGYQAGPYCSKIKYTDYPKQAKPLKICPYHRKFEVNNDEDKTVCSLCWEEGHHEKNYLVYPPEVVYQLNQMGNYPKSVPVHNRKCSGTYATSQMNFIYPKDSSKIWLPVDFNHERQKLVFKLATNQPNELVYWYIDDVYLGVTLVKHEKVIDMDEGWHVMTANSQNGATTNITFQVSRTNE